jgi:hypothetical protein
MVDFGDCQRRRKGEVLGLAHGNDLEGQLLHIFGCLKFSEREEVLGRLSATDALHVRISSEKQRIAKLRAIFDQQGLTTDEGKLFNSFKATMAMRFPRTRTHSRPSPGGQNAPNTEMSPKTGIFADAVALEDLTADVIYFKRTEGNSYLEPYSHPAVQGVFPNQQVPLDLLLRKDKKNPLSWKCDEDCIRYFHIPYNVR